MPVHGKITLMKLVLMDSHLIQEVTNLDAPSFQPKLYT